MTAPPEVTARRRARPVIAVVVALAFAVGLAGCASATGQPISTTERQIETIPGVASATISSDSSLDGFTRIQNVDVTVKVSEGYQVGDADAMITWLARESWSTGPKRPTVVSVSLEDATGKPLQWEWKAALAKRGWDVFPVDGLMSSDNVIILSGTRLTSLTGTSWPGPVPETPANLFVKN